MRLYSAITVDKKTKQKYENFMKLLLLFCNYHTKIFTSCSTSSMIVEPVMRLSHFSAGLPAFTNDTTCRIEQIIPTFPKVHQNIETDHRGLLKPNMYLYCKTLERIRALLPQKLLPAFTWDRPN